MRLSETEKEIIEEKAKNEKMTVNAFILKRLFDDSTEIENAISVLSAEIEALKAENRELKRSEQNQRDSYTETLAEIRSTYEVIISALKETIKSKQILIETQETKKDFGRGCLKIKKERFVSLFFVFNFLEKRNYNRNKKEKVKKKKSEEFLLKINERKELKEIAKNLAKISQSSDFFLNRNDVVTSTDKEHIKTKNLQLYGVAYILLEMSGATKEELESF